MEHPFGFHTTFLTALSMVSQSGDRMRPDDASVLPRGIVEIILLLFSQLRHGSGELALEASASADRIGPFLGF
jgi:hypothetical protein